MVQYASRAHIASVFFFFTGRYQLQEGVSMGGSEYDGGVRLRGGCVTAGDPIGAVARQDSGAARGPVPPQRQLHHRRGEHGETF